MIFLRIKGHFQRGKSKVLTLQQNDLSQNQRIKGIYILCVLTLQQNDLSQNSGDEWFEDYIGFDFTAK